MADEEKENGLSKAEMNPHTLTQSVSRGPEKSMLTEEELDDLIRSEDPEFHGTISGVSGVQLENVELYEYEENEDDRDPLWGRPKGWRKVIKKVFPPAPKVARKIRHFREHVKWLALATFDILKKILKEEVPRLLKIFLQQLFKLKDLLLAKAKVFSGWPLKQKVAFVGINLVGLFVLAFTFRVVTKGVIPKAKELFPHSLEDWAQASYTYDPREKKEPFYESGRVAGNLVLLNKLVANIRPGGGSSSNPMLAIEVFLEGTSPEVMIEVKDREPQVRDQLLRTMERSRYSELVEIEGKEHLAEELQKACNHILTTGKIKKIFYRTFIMKP